MFAHAGVADAGRRQIVEWVWQSSKSAVDAFVTGSGLSGFDHGWRCSSVRRPVRRPKGHVLSNP